MSDQDTSPSGNAPMTAQQLLEERVIEPDRFVADTEAFVDVRIERSKGKASYSFVGPGVSQNSDQVVNLTVPHGFQIGAATMPHGVVNNPHLHFTAEVFVCTSGSFQITIGEDSEQTVDIEAGTVFSAPTWVFRGFTNTGPDDGWLFAVLGGDDTGGIIWAPEVLAEAAATGLYLDPDYAVLDATAGDDISNAIEPLKPAQLSTIDSYTDAELAARAVTTDGLMWSENALLSASLDEHRSAMAPVIGFGLTEDRSHRAPITVPHGFSLEWLQLEPGASVGRHRHDDSQVLLLTEGQWQVELWVDDQSAIAKPETGSVVSVPPKCWRDLKNIGDTTAKAVVVCNGDNPTSIEWAPEIVTAAAAAGVARDASGYLAPVELIGSPADLAPHEANQQDLSINNHRRGHNEDH